MDWLLAPATPQVARALRTELAAFLRRHGGDPGAVGDAEVVISELIGNAVEHAGGPVWVSLDWTGTRPVLTVHDLGVSFRLGSMALPEVDSEHGRGLWLASQLAVELQVVAKRAGGTRVVATLAVTRAVTPSFDPPRRQVNALPTVEEAGPEGFGREAFLRALVVELARAAGDARGPAVVEQMIAQVGATIGGQMEDEYRRARAVVGRMSADQLTDCYLRLKTAIDGGFYLVSVTEERIELGNRRCPFGEVVRHAPALCRMTSSVFGGIAARNHGEATVVLAERIAVGDPECRVVVLLGSAADRAGQGHHYRAPVQ